MTDVGSDTLKLADLEALFAFRVTERTDAFFGRFFRLDTRAAIYF